MSRRKADLRLAQLTPQDGVTVKGNTLYQPLYAPVAYPSMFPRAMKSEKYALAIRVLLGSFSAIQRVGRESFLSFDERSSV
jgi:hypothetical protein